jgi:uncharacterized protein YkwD
MLVNYINWKTALGSLIILSVFLTMFLLDNPSKNLKPNIESLSSLSLTVSSVNISFTTIASSSTLPPISSSSLQSQIVSQSSVYTNINSKISTPDENIDNSYKVEDIKLIIDPPKPIQKPDPIEPKIVENIIVKSSSSQSNVQIVEAKVNTIYKSNNCGKELANQMLNLLNIHRKQNNVSNLVLANDLNEVACFHTQWMSDTGSFSHTGKDNTSPFERCKLAGTTCSAENIANNSDYTSAAFVEQFKNSPGHNTNMLNPNYTQAGFGFDGNNVTQLFR